MQPSIALESYLEHVKLSISEIEMTKPKHNLSHNEHKTVKELQKNAAFKLKRAAAFANCWRQVDTCLPTVFMLFTHTNLGLPTRVCQLKFAV